MLCIIGLNKERVVEIAYFYVKFTLNACCRAVIRITVAMNARNIRFFVIFDICLHTIIRAGAKVAEEIKEKLKTGFLKHHFHAHNFTCLCVETIGIL